MKYIKYYVYTLLAIVAIGYISNLVFTGGKALNAPLAVVNKTLDTNNIIHKYEWFYDTSEVFKTRANQVAQYKAFLADETNKGEKRLLRTELAGIQQVCRDLAAKYNANSQKMNVSVFKGWGLPDKLNNRRCEV